MDPVVFERDKDDMPISDPSKFENVVELYGPGVASCGYCKEDGGTREEGRYTFDMSAYDLTASVYQQLIDRGWRRSGRYCYYPNNSKTCCPNYCISCSATKLNLTRSQIKCIDKVHSFLVNGSHQEKIKIYEQTNEDHRIREAEQTPWKYDTKYIKENFDKLKQSSKARDRRFVARCEIVMSSQKLNLEEAIKSIRSKARYNRAGRCKLSLEDHLYPKKAMINISFLTGLKTKHRLQIRLVHVDSTDCKGLLQKEHEVLVKYQEAIHKETAEEWDMHRFKRFLVDTPLRTEPIRDRDYYYPNETNGDGESKSVDVHAIHQDEFLLVKPPELPTYFGTYHCLYMLDDELIAVGVLDILPKCITTVYFFYNPMYSNLNLGIYSALVELSIVRQMFQHYRGPPGGNHLKYYYIGFYVHQSKKMRYKTTFKPSYLLCTITSHFVPLEKCLLILKQRKYARFDLENEPESTVSRLEDLLSIPVLAPVMTNSIKLLDYLCWVRDNTSQRNLDILIRECLLQYAQGVGTNLLTRILVKLRVLHRALVTTTAR